MSSNLSRFAKFLAEMGTHRKLMGRKKMRKSIEVAGITEAELELLRSGNAAKVEAYLAQAEDDDGRPLPQQGPGG